MVAAACGGHPVEAGRSVLRGFGGVTADTAVESDAPWEVGESEPAGARRSRQLPHALQVLEFQRVLDLVAREATSDLGARRIVNLLPGTAAREVREALLTSDEMASFLLREEAWRPGPIPDLRSALRHLRVTDSVLEPEPLRQVAVLLATAIRVRTRLLAGDRSRRERLAALARGLARLPEHQERLERSFDEAGEVADGASPELKRIRGALRTRRAQLVQRLESFAASLPARHRVPDASVTVRSGRYCVPIRREGRSSVGGIVHDESASRQTLFVEPPLAIEPMNRVRELELAESREVRRILAELTESLRPVAEDLVETLERLTEVDALFARARYGLAHGGTLPEIGGEGARELYRVAEGRHPLLLESEERAIPFHLELQPEETVLLVSGPNAGGKTVLLKSMGLFSAMAQSGIVPPVGAGTRLPCFGRFFAIIGDEQSIVASLSTFSAQVRNLREILEESDGRSLVLADELGSNTDPAEGAALAAAVLLRLSQQAGLTVATTHLGELKSLAGESPRIVNASLQFDARALRPTFRLRRDRPGRSYALEIAARHGLSQEVLEVARSRLSSGDRAMERVLEELEAREAELERLEWEIQSRERELARLEEDATRRVEDLKERERELVRRERERERDARRRAEQYLLEARERVEEAIRRLEEQFVAAAAEEAAGEAPATERSRAAAASEARGEVERAVRESRRKAPAPTEDPTVPPSALREGANVRIRSLDRMGELRELRGDRAVVSTGGVRLTLPTADIEPSPADGGNEGGRREEGRRPELEPRTEVDLRGLRVEEVEAELLSAVDAAIYADLPLLRIIHGKGTGALRQRVQELLRGDPRIPAFRAGERGEGGSGVTVVEFREEEA